MSSSMHPGSVKDLFNEMSATYGIVNLWSSLGFAYFWRKRCGEVAGPDCRNILDVMSGSGEMVPHLVRKVPDNASITLVDFSEGMTARARKNATRWARSNLDVLIEDALDMSAEDEVFDCVTCCFGLKTLSEVELEQFIREIWRVTAPQGRISFLEFSVPRNRWIGLPFKLYVKHYVPFLGRLFLGNPDNYRMLWHYTSQFSDCSKAARLFEAVGFQIEFREHFMGCATQISGYKPMEPLVKHEA